LDEALLTLGADARRIIFNHLENEFELRHDDIGEASVVKVHECFERIFGAATKAIEKHVAKHLFKNLGLDFAERRFWHLVPSSIDGQIGKLQCIDRIWYGEEN
jgi:hypothetical protein